MKWESMYYGLGMAADYLDPENYQRNMGRTYSDIIDTKTGKHLDKATDDELIQDNSTLDQGKNALPTTGIAYVVVNGTIVVKDSKVLLDVYPGRPIRNP